MLVQLSAGEEEAERIYYAAISRRYTFKEAVLAAKQLEFESPDGAAYLRWLLSRHGDLWPRVRGSTEPMIQKSNTFARKQLESSLNKHAPAKMPPRGER